MHRPRRNDLTNDSSRKSLTLVESRKPAAAGGGYIRTAQQNGMLELSIVVSLLNHSVTEKAAIQNHEVIP